MKEKGHYVHYVVHLFHGKRIWNDILRLFMRENEPSVHNVQRHFLAKLIWNDMSKQFMKEKRHRVPFVVLRFLEKQISNVMSKESMPENQNQNHHLYKSRVAMAMYISIWTTDSESVFDRGSEHVEYNANFDLVFLKSTTILYHLGFFIFEMEIIIKFI